MHTITNIFIVGSAVPDTPTCNVADQVATKMSMSYNTSLNLDCWTFDPCEEIRCIFYDGQDILRIILDKCNDPPAVRLIDTVENGRVWFDHTFTYSDSLTVYYSGYELMWNVTVVQLDSGIGFKVGMCMKRTVSVFKGIYYISATL